MGVKIRNMLLGAIICLGSAAAMNASAQQSMEREPANWTKEDATPKARYQTSLKEAKAAYRENLAQCKSMSGSERAACNKEARTVYQDDLALAKKKLTEPEDSASGQ